MEKIVEMKPENVDDVVQLIKAAMNPDEAAMAKKTFNYHFKCRYNEIDDGRYYYILKNGLETAGIVGLHHYHWGPEENVWLAWFAVRPDTQGAGAGKKLIQYAENTASSMGYKKIFIETYTSKDFAKARGFYESQGYQQVGAIQNYMPDNVDMLVYGKLV